MAFTGRTTTNLVANAAGFSANVLVGVFFTPYLVRHLGVAVFGVIPLATTLASYMSVITLTLNGAVARFVTLAVERGDHDGASRYFNTSVFGSLALAVLLAVPGTLLVLNSDAIVRLPAGHEREAQLFFAATVAMLILSVVGAPFEVASFCTRRFDIRNLIAVSAVAARVGTVVLLFGLFPASLISVGVATVTAALLSLAGAIAARAKLMPALKITLRHFSVRALAILGESGVWLSISQVGTLLLLSIDLLVVNRLFGPDHSGRYASLLQWPILVRGLGLTLSAVLAPSLIGIYARGDIAGVIAYARRSVRLLGLALALPVGLIAGLGRPLLGVWLGSDFEHLAPLLTMMVLPLAVNVGYVPLHGISTATNNVRVPGLVQVAAGLVNLALALWLAGPLGFGVGGVAAAGLIVLSARNLVFTPLYAAHLLGVSRATFFADAGAIALATGCVFAVARLGAYLFRIDTFGALAACGFGICCVYVALTLPVFLRARRGRTVNTELGADS